MEKDKKTFNEQMDGFIAAVATMTQQQIDAFAWVVGVVGCGWTKESIIAELTAEKHDEA